MDLLNRTGHDVDLDDGVWLAHGDTAYGVDESERHLLLVEDGVLIDVTEGDPLADGPTADDAPDEADDATAPDGADDGDEEEPEPEPERAESATSPEPETVTSGPGDPDAIPGPALPDLTAPQPWAPPTSHFPSRQES